MTTTSENSIFDTPTHRADSNVFYATMISSVSPVIDLRGIEKRFGYGDTQTIALDGVDLVIERGEFVAIMGPSGCGKTTLLNIIGLLDQPTGGEYKLNSKNVAKLPPGRKAKIRNREIGFVFQNFNLIHKLTVIDNVALPLTYSRGLNYKHQEKASKILTALGLHSREYYMPYQLSGGQMQRVAIARAILTQPDFILADEPTGNLDESTATEIMAILNELHSAGSTILLITHEADIAKHAERTIRLRDGKVEAAA